MVVFFGQNSPDQESGFILFAFLRRVIVLFSLKFSSPVGLAPLTILRTCGRAQMSEMLVVTGKEVAICFWIIRFRAYLKRTKRSDSCK